MLKPQVHRYSTPTTVLLPFSKPFLHGNCHVFRQVQPSPSLKIGSKVRVSCHSKRHNVSSKNIEAIATSTEKSVSVISAVVTVKATWKDDYEDYLFGRTLRLELVSAELDHTTGSEKSTIYAHASKAGKDKHGNELYEATFNVPSDFGEVGAMSVENEHHVEIYLMNIVLDGFSNGDPVNITCNSWIQPKNKNEPKRIFFTNKSYLPSQTPDGLKRFRIEELYHLRGNGQGVRQPSDRIYDYDVYNDLGNPDKRRPVLGGKKFPYPRRCRTGRPHYESDPLKEKRDKYIYVPRDETFTDVKQEAFDNMKDYKSKCHAALPYIEKFFDGDKKFEYFTEIDELFNEDGFSLPEAEPGFLNSLARFAKKLKEMGEEVFQFDAPEAMLRDKFLWFRDEEFARQTLAGLNPCSIQLITEWPLKSSLDPKIYGPQESAITKDIIEKELGAMISVEEAIEQKKLFMLDYHDLFLPYVEKVRKLEHTTLYGSRTVFFLTPDNTLRPLAIELTRPPMDDKPHWRKVYTPGSWNSTKTWLWRLAKAHVLAHDSGYHQLVSHWLRSHCVVEPYIIATNRQLSVMHPIYRLLHPHLRYTLELNAIGRDILISAGGVIENTFSPGEYCLEMSSVIYDKQWRFDEQALPKDLIKRGMAVEDPNARHGLKLTIDDYPFAKDGLDLWGILKQWVTDYVNHYYPDQSLVESDDELQAWWTEIQTVGHADKKDEPWWPVLKTPQNLIEILTTIIWVASGHHAAVNFGQYTYAAYFPNRPTIARVNMPDEDPTQKIWKTFIEKPEDALLYTFPNQDQAILVIATLDLLSTHSPDEEFLGKDKEPAWGEDPVINAAFEKFSGRLMELEGIIDERNGDSTLVNRNGAGVVPYNLLKPYWKDGDKEKGVPYSISI